jgi:hypothetical protein
LFAEDVITLPLRAPQKPGRYCAYFRLFCDGSFIGERLCADVTSYEEEPGWQIVREGEYSDPLSLKSEEGSFEGSEGRPELSKLNPTECESALQPNKQSLNFEFQH